MSDRLVPPVLSTPLQLVPCPEGTSSATMVDMTLPSIDELIRAFAIDWEDLLIPLDGGSWGGGSSGGKGH